MYYPKEIILRCIILNNNFTVRRADIFMADLQSDDTELLKGQHPVLILSNHKSNKNSNLINIVPITSKIKENPSNIKIGIESGLKYESTVLCNQITTIDKKDLLFKVGFVNSSLMDEVIKTIICQLSGKYSQIDIEKRNKLDYMFNSIKKICSLKIKYGISDLEIDLQIKNEYAEFKNYCNSLNVNYKEWGNLEIFKVYEEKRREIRIARLKKDHVLTAKLSQEYLNMLCEMNFISCDKDLLYKEFEWAYLKKAQIIKQTGDYLKSYDLAKQSLSFSNEEDNNRILTYWLIGEICFSLGENFKTEGIAAIEKCISFYKKIGEKKYQILCEFNYQKILRNIEGMKKCIIKYKNTQFKNILHDFGDMGNDEVLEQLEKELNDML